MLQITLFTLMGKELMQGSLTSPTEPFNVRARKATGVLCSGTQRIERRGSKTESGEDKRLKPLKKKVNKG
jgi:hypothetical protein